MNAAWNRVVNALSLIAGILMISTGFLLKWVLPAGSGRIEMAARGRHGRAIYTVLGLDRHDWGEIHFYISLALVLLLGTHLFLHWKWIRITAWGTAACPQKPARKLLTMGILLFIAAVLAFPWIIRKEIY